MRTLGVSNVVGSNVACEGLWRDGERLGEGSEQMETDWIFGCLSVAVMMVPFSTDRGGCDRERRDEERLNGREKREGERI